MSSKIFKSRLNLYDTPAQGASVMRAMTVAAIVCSFVWSQLVIAEAHDDCKDCMKGVSEIKSCDESKEIVGSAQLTELKSNEGVKVVAIELEIEGLDATPGAHAVHIHESGMCDPCSAAKGHFDPGPHGFTNPDGNHPFHSGDLENIYLDENGNGELNVLSTRITLSDGPLSIFDDDGSAFIIHVEADTYCPEGEAKGCAGGARAACGIITKVVDAEVPSD